MKEATVEPVSAIEEKTPATRLLDLVAGWSEFVGTDEESGIYDPLLSGDELAGLYQEVGGISAGWYEAKLTAEEEKAQVKAFVEARILPLLLR